MHTRTEILVTMHTFKNTFIRRSIQALFAALFFLLSGTQQAHATHAAGSDIKYKCLGGLVYEIEVTFYRDCGGVAEPNNITITYSSANAPGNFSKTVTANKSTVANNGAEITVPCTGTSSTCGGGSGTGIRKWIYTAQVTLPSAQTDWVFSYSVCCRNCSITTISNPCASNSTLYVEAKLNNLTASCNNSPTFSNIPIAFVCIGQNFNYNHGVLDPDGDSLAYQLITPKTTATTNVSFISPASATSPIASSTPFSLNATTGDLNFTPSQVQIGILALLVKEYRNGQLIGSVIRDMQVYTTACSNTLPTASGINGTNNFSVTACPGQQLCFTINTADADATQNVTVTTNNGISGATYTISNGSRPTLTFCWTPTIADIDLSPKTFTVTVRDNACPSNGIQTFSYSVYVPSPYFNVSSTNIACSGASTGTATATPVYSGNYSYSWNTTPPATTASVSNLPAGTYTVTTTDPSGCSVQKSVTITEPAGMTLSNSSNNPSCGNVSNGSIDLTVSGGVAPYTYSWSSGQTSQDLSNVAAGTYTVTVTDANNCSKSTSITLSNSYSVSLQLSATSVACYGGNSGAVAATVTGGSGSITYAWSNGASTQNLSSVIAGTYTLTITDQNGCTANANASVTQPASALTVTTSKTNVSCNGNATGIASVYASGGTSPYTYLWSNGGTTSSISNLSAGTYTVTVTDNRSCTTSTTVTITQPTAALATSLTGTNINCFGGATGAVSSSTSGGTTPYTYSWSNGASTANISNLTAGSFTLTVTDANGCSATASVSVTQPAAALSASASATDVLCRNGNTGSVTLTVNGGTPAYSYNWSNGASSQNLSNLVAGTYTVTITDSKGCTTSAQATVSQPAAVLSASATQTNVLCNGNNTGDITLSTSGGTSPYTYSWSNGSTSANISNLAAGTYTVTVTDANACTTSLSRQITQPAAALSLTTGKTDVRCYGDNTGNATVQVAGGTSPYTYSWNTGATTSAINAIAAGTYTVTVTDANGCTAAANATVSQPAAALTVSTSTTPVLCFDNSTGSATATPSGGTAPYSYLWSNGSGADQALGLTAGTYTVRVTDANGCVTNANATVTQPSATLSVTGVRTQVLCHGNNTGAIDITPNGGTTPYSFSWSSGATTEDINNLTAGSYTVTITDANGCSITATYFITQPLASLTLSLSNTAVNCYSGSDGSVSSQLSGGTTPYTYVWSTGASTPNINALTSGTYTLTVTDANGCSAIASSTITQPSAALQASATHTDVACNGGSVGSIDLSVSGGTTPYAYLWSNGSQQQDITNLPAGTFSVTITDANGCTESVTETVGQPAGALNASSSATNVSCFGGSNGAIDVTASAGTPPYSFLWSNGATTEDISNLTAGAYSVTINDNNNCQLLFTFFVTEPAAALSGTFASTAVACYGDPSGNLDLTVNGGTSPYTFTWSNGASTEDLSALIAGTYTVSITDANGCTWSGNETVAQPAAALQINAQVNNLNCHDIDDASIDISVSGGTAPFTYQWNDGASSEDLTGLSEGSYTITVTDANACTATMTYTIVYNAALFALNGIVTPVSCYNDPSGSIDLTVAGGTGPFTFNWSNSATTEDLNNIANGAYTVTATDANGCTATYTTYVGQPLAGLNASASTTDVLCFGNATGAIDLTVTGGTYPYQFNWSNGATTEDINGITTGSYTVTVTDANNCSFTNTYSINQPAATLNATTSITDVACYGNNTGSITATISGGTAPYQISWNGQASTAQIDNLPSGSYTLFVIDTNGCTFTLQADVNQPAAALDVTASSSAALCFGANSGSASLGVTGGTAPYTYLWSNGDTNANAANLSAGTYSFTVTDANQCTSSGSVTITEPAAALSLSATTTDVKCYGESTGSIDLTVQGGTPAYTYLWSDNSSSEDPTALPTGTYTVTVTDANNCSATQSFSIQQPAAALSVQGTTADVKCYGDHSGSIQLQVNGGTSPYQYSWSTGDTIQDLTQIAQGTYSVQITDNQGCTASGNYTIAEPTAALDATASTITPVGCKGSSTGSIQVSTTGGTNPYTYLWSNGATTKDISNLSAGTYTLTATDANGCTFVLNADITEPSASLSCSFLVTDVLCKGGSDGIVTANAAGGTAPYTYQWNNGTSSSTISNQPAGAYSVTVTDANGCTYNAAVTISEPFAAVSVSLTPHHILCNGAANGSIDAAAQGGIGTLVYNWSNGGTTASISNLIPGTYALVVTDQHGCTATASETITEPTPSLGVSGTTSDVTCKGANNGSITLNVMGGTPGYSYIWSTGATTANLSNLSSGTYTATVTDANGCTESYTGTISEPTQNIQASSQIADANCIGNAKGGIDLTTTGGTPPYRFMWQDGPSTEDRSGLEAGTYTVQITDAQGCSFSSTFTVNDLSKLEIKANGDPTICMGSDIVLSTDSTPGITYQWYYNGNALNGANGASFVTPVAGTYTVSATNTCGTFTSNEIKVAVRTMNTVSISNDVIVCTGESVQLHAGGGEEYLWSPSAGLNYNNVSNPIASPTKTTVYTVTVKDRYGCEARASVTVSVICDTLDIPNGYSPNGDGTNDYFVIDGIDNYPGNVLFIYNRWGNLIFKTKDYDNKWDGHSNVSGAMFGDELPNGTYYYILDLNIGEKPLNGFVVIRR